MHIRIEHEIDYKKIRHIHLSAFDSETEANLVEALRASGVELISLVAEEENELVGHILFSPVILDTNQKLKIIGLAPMAVLPEWQNKGIGTLLVNQGLQACKDAGYQAVVVLGHPQYYPRFGFTPSVNFGIKSEYDVPPEVFMILELDEGCLQNKKGSIKYHDAFNEV